MSDTEASTGTTETPALPGDGLREGIVDALRAQLGDRLVDVHLVPQDDLWVRVSSDAWATTAEALRRQGFEYFCFLSAIDWMPSPYGRGEDDPSVEPEPEPDDAATGPVIAQGYTGGETRFQVFARVTDIRRHVSVTIKADVPESMSMPTWIPSYAGANWHEREAHEMFGIGFEGHPDLRNLYLPGEFEGFPLRKDFPLLSRMVKPWPGIVDVEPMPAAAEEEATGDAAPGDAATDDTPPDDAATEDAGTDETATGVAATGVAATEDAATDETATDETATGEAASVEAATDDAATDDAATDDAETGDAVAADDAATDGAATDDAATDDAATDAGAADDADTDDAAADDAATAKPATDAPAEGDAS